MSDALIHWSSSLRGVCERKDAKTDERRVTQANGTSITWTGEADHPDNVTCEVCLNFFVSLYEDD